MCNMLLQLKIWTCICSDIILLFDSAHNKVYGIEVKSQGPTSDASQILRFHLCYF